MIRPGLQFSMPLPDKIKPVPQGPNKPTRSWTGGAEQTSFIQKLPLQNVCKSSSKAVGNDVWVRSREKKDKYHIVFATSEKKSLCKCSNRTGDGTEKCSDGLTGSA